MKLGIILNTNDPETAWNALRLGEKALGNGDEASMFLLGAGVEIVNIDSDVFDIGAVRERFLGGGGRLMSCVSCLDLRQQQAGMCTVSNMGDLAQLISESDRLVTLG